MSFVADPFICLPIAASIIVGGLGFPVWAELGREFRTPRSWSVHTKLVLLTTALLLVGGTAAITMLEWTNPGTLGPHSAPTKLLAGFFQAVVPRTAGFNTVDYGQMNQTTWLVTDILMFIGGGPGSTAGGIKVTTFMLLFIVILAEVRGDLDTNLFDRRVPPMVIRQAISVALLGVAAVVGGTLIMISVTDLSLDRALFEVTSAFATAGLSTGITPHLPAAGQYLLIALMFIGRVGTVTLAAALALRESARLFRLPEERPIVG